MADGETISAEHVPVRPATSFGRAKHFLGELWERMGAENIALMAAGVAFYCFLSLVPLLGAVILTYGLIADPSTVASAGRMKFWPRSKIFCSLRLGEDNASCRIGTVEAL